MFSINITARLRQLLVYPSLALAFALALTVPPTSVRAGAATVVRPGWLVTGIAPVQVDPVNHDIFQDGKKVGEIYVPDREPGATNYIEHWVLFSDYIYPNRNLPVVTTIKASRFHDASAEQFFARVEWGPGFRYVRVEAFDTDKLPTR